MVTPPSGIMVIPAMVDTTILAVTTVAPATRLQTLYCREIVH